MKKCNKVKNPCKICFEAVTKKTGLQCQGACQKWAHFKCLNYTPGKIQDIKAKVIKITCPCPDCDTSQPKEVLTDPPFTCTNHIHGTNTQCPANKLPVCASIECPSKENPIPTYPPPPFEYSPAHAPISSPKCQNKETSPSPKRTSSPTQCNISPRISLTKKLNSSCSPCPSQVKITVNKNFSPKQSQSCSDFSNNSNYSGKQCAPVRSISSDSQLSGADQTMLFSALENLCNTVGQLSTQLRELMCKMKAIRVQ